MSRLFDEWAEGELKVQRLVNCKIYYHWFPQEALAELSEGQFTQSFTGDFGFTTKALITEKQLSMAHFSHQTANAEKKDCMYVLPNS
ncbi:hypothetical protein B1F79_05075 [Coxiella-like endosymbiont of Rhipicephalus sanguineus]|nr:hypothetical protein [Coxiella-like endosymbiont of Rhipicephalus sanguineus]